jgi:hypothetical protein
MVHEEIKCFKTSFNEYYWFWYVFIWYSASKNLLVDFEIFLKFNYVLVIYKIENFLVFLFFCVIRFLILNFISKPTNWKIIFFHTTLPKDHLAGFYHESRSVVSPGEAKLKACFLTVRRFFYMFWLNLYSKCLRGINYKTGMLRGIIFLGLAHYYV